MSVKTNFNFAWLDKHNTKVIRHTSAKLDLTFTNVDLTNVRCQTLIIGQPWYTCTCTYHCCWLIRVDNGRQFPPQLTKGIIALCLRLTYVRAYMYMVTTCQFFCVHVCARACVCTLMYNVRTMLPCVGVENCCRMRNTVKTPIFFFIVLQCFTKCTLCRTLYLRTYSTFLHTTLYAYIHVQVFTTVDTQQN